MLLCPECRTENDDSRRYCARCGAPLDYYSDAPDVEYDEDEEAEDWDDEDEWEEDDWDDDDSDEWDGEESDETLDQSEPVREELTSYEAAFAPIRADAEAARAARKTAASNANGPVGIPTAMPANAKAAAAGKHAAPSRSRELLLCLLDIALVGLISYPAWIYLYSRTGATPYSLPKLALGMVDAAMAILTGNAGDAGIARFVIRGVAGVMWVIVIQFLLRDVYQDVLSKPHAHLGAVNLIIMIVVTLIAVYAINVTITDSHTVFAPDIPSATSSIETMSVTVWVFVALGLSVLTLLLGRG